jgi:hypothetical protein
LGVEGESSTGVGCNCGNKTTRKTNAFLGLVKSDVLPQAGSALSFFLQGVLVPVLLVGNPSARKSVDEFAAGVISINTLVVTTAIFSLLAAIAMALTFTRSEALVCERCNDSALTVMNLAISGAASFFVAMASFVAEFTFSLLTYNLYRLINKTLIPGADWGLVAMGLYLVLGVILLIGVLSLCRLVLRQDNASRLIALVALSIMLILCIFKLVGA